MANWKEPKSDYKAEDQVTPDIFNTLAENEKTLERDFLQGRKENKKRNYDNDLLYRFRRAIGC